MAGRGGDLVSRVATARRRAQAASSDGAGEAYGGRLPQRLRPDARNTAWHRLRLWPAPPAPDQLRSEPAAAYFDADNAADVVLLPRTHVVMLERAAVLRVQLPHAALDAHGVLLVDLAPLTATCIGRAVTRRFGLRLVRMLAHLAGKGRFLALCITSA